MSRFRLPSRLSLMDVAALDICEGGACQDLPLDTLLGIAFEHGLDIDRGYKFEKGLHRTVLSGVVNGEYLIAEERMDVEWLNSGNASLEAITLSSDDSSLTEELNRLRG